MSERRINFAKIRDILRKNNVDNYYFDNIPDYYLFEQNTNNIEQLTDQVILINSYFFWHKDGAGPMRK